MWSTLIRTTGRSSGAFYEVVHFIKPNSTFCMYFDYINFKNTDFILYLSILLLPVNNNGACMLCLILLFSPPEQTDCDIFTKPLRNGTSKIQFVVLFGTLPILEQWCVLNVSLSLVSLQSQCSFQTKGSYKDSCLKDIVSMHNCRHEYYTTNIIPLNYPKSLFFQHQVYLQKYTSQGRCPNVVCYNSDKSTFQLVCNSHKFT